MVLNPLQSRCPTKKIANIHTSRLKLQLTRGTPLEEAKTKLVMSEKEFTKAALAGNIFRMNQWNWLKPKNNPKPKL